MKIVRLDCYPITISEISTTPSSLEFFMFPVGYLGAANIVGHMMACLRFVVRYH
ncbi:unnamed protein product [Linum tenue]|uniref:Uncharacterized protein n=1 Tax=Linum tenue TaxID=586396 RepID=A0AAV0H9H6_9ROSI|nr:unnamed protein product [Linum tenue]